MKITSAEKHNITSAKKTESFFTQGKMALSQENPRTTETAASETLQEIQKAVQNALSNGFGFAINKYPLLDQSVKAFEAATGYSKKYLITGMVCFLFISSVFQQNLSNLCLYNSSLVLWQQLFILYFLCSFLRFC